MELPRRRACNHRSSLAETLRWWGGAMPFSRSAVNDCSLYLNAELGIFRIVGRIDHS